MNKKEFLLSLVSGLLVCLSFPKAEFHFFIWIALVPLLYAIRGKDLPGAFRVGFLTGLVYHIGLMYWIVFVTVRYGHLPFYAGVSVMLLLVMYLSLYPALFCAGVAYFARRKVAVALIAPLLWTSLEYLKSHLLSGFPWGNLAHSQHGCLPLIQIADITGTFGITFLIVLVNCVIYDLLNGLFPLPGRRRNLRLFETISTMILLLLVCGYGMDRMTTLNSDERCLEPVNVIIVQGNIDQSIKWTPQYQQETIDIYRRLSLEGAAGDAELMVWPETAVPFCFQNYDDKARDLIDIARETGAWFLFGSPAYHRGGEGDVSFYNSAYLLAPAGSVAGRYDKGHLVPFGEYVPFEKLLFFLDKLVEGAGDFTPGDEIIPLQMGDKSIGPLICYEGIFPEISRTHRLRGAGLLVNVTNDAWYGDSSAPYQHLTIAVFRAVENRMWLVRAANTGISAMVSATGAIVSRTELFERTTLSGQVRFTHDRTIYSRYGNIFACFCAGFLLIAFLVSLRRKSA